MVAQVSGLVCSLKVVHLMRSIGFRGSGTTSGLNGKGTTRCGSDRLL